MHTWYLYSRSSIQNVWTALAYGSYSTLLQFARRLRQRNTDSHSTGLQVKLTTIAPEEAA